MTKVETGSHLGMSLVHCHKVSAMILEPVSTGVVLHTQYVMFPSCAYYVVSHHTMSYVCHWYAAASAVQGLHRQQFAGKHCAKLPATRVAAHDMLTRHAWQTSIMPVWMCQCVH